MIELNRAIDATLLTPWASPADVRALCEEGCALQVGAVCVLPFHAPLAASIVAGTRVAVAAAISFPSGGASPRAKAAEAHDAALAGARELDAVLNLGAIRAGAWNVIEAELGAVRQAAPDLLVKWILECGALSTDEIRRAVAAVGEGNGDFVKTSTGYGPRGATVEDVRLLRSLAGPMGVKASGGIRTRDFAIALLEAGADRIGTSAAAAILRPDGAALRAGAPTPTLRGAV